MYSSYMFNFKTKTFLPKKEALFQNFQRNAEVINPLYSIQFALSYKEQTREDQLQNAQGSSLSTSLG